MKILWFTWKDRQNPAAGGAEVVNEELAKRLAKAGHEVVFIVAGFKGGKREETTTDGYKIIRLGNRFSLYWYAYRYYKNNLIGWPDLVIEEINTVPFLTKFYVKERYLLFIHMLCRWIWFYQIPLPFSLIGYLLEPFYLWLLRNSKVITVSASTKKDLLRYGFKSGNIEIISEGIDLRPVENLEDVEKYPDPTVLSLGTLRTMKRTDHQIRAFELSKKKLPHLKLKVAGSSFGPYGKKILQMMKASPYSSDIEYLGKVDLDQKIELMQKCHLIAVTSIKEGWGLVVTEAASQGTPAIVYDVDGLRDSVQPDRTGLVCRRNTPEGLAENIVGLLSDQNKYRRLQELGWRWSHKISFDASYKQFSKVLL